jgi:molecular chaperone GrpE (heat shock protein)
MMSRTRTFAAAMLIPSALAVAACGGGVSKEDYAQDLDEICSDLEEQTEKIGQLEPDNPAELTGQLDDLREAIRQGIDRMKDVERPEGDDGETAEEYVNELETTLNDDFLPALDDLEAAVKAKDQVKARTAAAQLQAIDEERTEELARDLGADECAEG